MDTKGSGFAKDDPKERIHLVSSIEGQTSTGRSHLACTAPGPIAFIDMDYNSDPVRAKFKAQGKQIYYAKHMIPGKVRHMKPTGKMGQFKGTYVKAAVDTWAAVTEDYYWALEHARTVVVDTATELWELCRLAHLLPEWGRIEHIKSHHYTPLNTDFRNLLRAGYESDANVILTHKVKKEYKGDSWSGKYERAGFGDIDFVCQVNMLTMVDKYGDFTVKILKCTQNPSLVGEVLEYPMNTIPMIGQMVFPNSKGGDWK